MSNFCFGCIYRSPQSWDSKQSFVTWVLSFKYTGTTDQNTALLRAARRNRGYGKPDPSVFPSVIALPQTLPKHVGGRTRTLRSNCKYRMYIALYIVCMLYCMYVYRIFVMKVGILRSNLLFALEYVCSLLP